MLLGGDAHKVVRAGQTPGDHQHDDVGVALPREGGVDVLDVLRAGQAGLEVLGLLAGVDLLDGDVDVVAVAFGAAAHDERHREDRVLLEHLAGQIAAGLGDDGNFFGSFHVFLPYI